MELEEKEFSLLALCSEITSVYQTKIKGDPVQLMLQYDTKIDHAIIGDSIRLQQILGNILSNACKFTREGAIVLEVVLIENKHDCYHVKFAVHDTGIGIAEAKQKKIFEKFKQADATTGNDFGGTGLGLSIVKQLVELFGGFIELESREEEGSTFSFIIDLKKSANKAGEMKAVSRAESKSNKSLHNIDFLVVDDNPTNLKLMAKLFDMWGCRYELAMSGKEALVKTREQVFDLILMDLRMPVMDGCETTRKIRNDALNQNRKTPVIALSAAILPADRKQALLAGMDDFMPKPFSPPQLLECLHQHLKFKINPTNLVSTAAGKPILEGQTKNGDFVSMPNIAYLLKFSDGDREFVRDILNTFLHDAPVAINQLEELLANGKNIEAANILHRFKPNLQTLGLNSLKNNSELIENELKNTSSPNAIDLVRMCQPFLSELRQSLSNLRHLLNEL